MKSALPQRGTFLLSVAIHGRPNPLHPINGFPSFSPPPSPIPLSPSSSPKPEHSHILEEKSTYNIDVDDIHSDSETAFETNTEISAWNTTTRSLTTPFDDKSHHSSIYTSAKPSCNCHLTPYFAPQSNIHSGSYGQDAYYVFTSPDCNVQSIGIADGVGGWRSNGVDSGIMARALMSTTLAMAKQRCPLADGQGKMADAAVSPLTLLSDAYHNVKASGLVEAGSTTASVFTISTFPLPTINFYRGTKTEDIIGSNNAPKQQNESVIGLKQLNDCIMRELLHDHQETNNAIDQVIPPQQNINPDNIRTTKSTASSDDTEFYFNAANVGDCGYFIFRNGMCVHRSDFQRIGRVVKQLAVIPDRFKGHQYCDDQPETAALSSCMLKYDDLIIICSDGLHDNLTPPPPMMFSLMLGLSPSSESMDAYDARLFNRLEEIIAKSISCFEEDMKSKPSCTCERKHEQTSRLVDYVCGQLYSNACLFMNHIDGKIDDLTLAVIQVQRPLSTVNK